MARARQVARIRSFAWHFLALVGLASHWIIVVAALQSILDAHVPAASTAAVLLPLIATPCVALYQLRGGPRHAGMRKGGRRDADAPQAKDACEDDIRRRGCGRYRADCQHCRTPTHAPASLPSASRLTRARGRGVQIGMFNDIISKVPWAHLGLAYAHGIPAAMPVVLLLVAVAAGYAARGRAGMPMAAARRLIRRCAASCSSNNRMTTRAVSRCRERPVRYLPLSCLRSGWSAACFAASAGTVGATATRAAPLRLGARNRWDSSATLLLRRECCT